MKLSMRLAAFMLSSIMLLSIATACKGKNGDDTSNTTSGVTESDSDSSDNLSGDVADASSEEEISADESNVSVEGNTDSNKTISNKTTSNKTTSNKTTNVNLRGKTFTIADPWGEFYKPSKSGVSEYRDDLLAFYQKIEKETGCKIVNKSTGPYSQFMNDYTAACLSGTFYADIISSQIWQTRSWMRSGYLAELDKISTINLKDDKYIDSKTNLGYYDSHYYATDFTSWYGRYINFNGGAMLVNLDLMKSKGIDIYKLIENGQWTRTKFREIAKQFTYSKGGKKIDRWGVCAVNWQNMLWSSGERTAKWNGSKYVFGLDRTKSTAAFQYLLDMMYVDKSISWEWQTSSTYYGATDLWPNQKVAFYPIDMEWLTYGDEEESWFLDVEFNYGLIPYPNFTSDNAATNFKGQFYGETRVLSIPKTASKGGHTLQEVGAFFDLFTDPLPGTTKDTWKTYIKDELFQGNDKSFNMYFKMLNNAEFDHSVDMGSLQLIPLQTTLNNMFTKQDKTPSEAIELEAKAFQTYLDGFVNNDAKLLKSHK